MILFFLPVLFVVILGPGGHPRDGDAGHLDSSAAGRAAATQVARATVEL